MKDAEGNPVDGGEVEVAYAKSDVTQTFKVNGSDGKYAAIVKADQSDDVIVTIKKEGAAFDSKLITKEELTKSDDPVIRGTDLNVKELKEGEAYTINDILFATNSYALTEKSKFIIKQFARFLNANSTVEVVIQGHTDDVGEDSKNLVLSENRAQEVKNYLVSLGIKSSRLNAKGYGETQPKVANTSESNRAINRRTDFFISKL